MDMDNESRSNTPKLNIRLGKKFSNTFFIRSAGRTVRCYVCKQYILPNEVYASVEFRKSDLDKFWFSATPYTHSLCLNCLADYFSEHYKYLLTFMEIQPDYKDLIDLSRKKQILIVKLIKLFNRGFSYKDYKLFKYPELFIEEVLIPNLNFGKSDNKNDVIFVNYDDPVGCPYELVDNVELKDSMFELILNMPVTFYNEYGFPVDSVNVRVLGYVDVESLHYYLCFVVSIDEHNTYRVLVRLGV